MIGQPVELAREPPPGRRRDGRLRARARRRDGGRRARCLRARTTSRRRGASSIPCSRRKRRLHVRTGNVGTGRSRSSIGAFGRLAEPGHRSAVANNAARRRDRRDGISARNDAFRHFQARDVSARADATWVREFTRTRSGTFGPRGPTARTAPHRPLKTMAYVLRLNARRRHAFSRRGVPLIESRDANAVCGSGQECRRQIFMKPGMHMNQKRHRGFTLLELMVGLTLVGMMLVAGLPSFTTFLRNSEVRSTAESISNGLRVSRAEATRLNRTVSFTIAGGGDPTGRSTSFDPDDGNARAAPAADRINRAEAGLNARAVVAPANAVAVTFNGLGRLISPSPIATPNLQQIDMTSTVAGEARRCAFTPTICAASDLRSRSGDARMCRRTRGPAEMGAQSVQTRFPCDRARQRGSSLLEALISILIFAFGDLGLIGSLADRCGRPTMPVTAPKPSTWPTR